MTGYISPATKILRYPGVLCAMQHGERVWPLHVEMDLAGVCNLHCGHCRFGDRQDGALMDRETAEGLLEDLAEGGTLAVTFSGGGEPTMNKHFVDVVTHARWAGLKVGVYSNGVLGDRLVKVAGVASWIYVSLDADNAADYEAVKGVNAFDQACDTVTRLSSNSAAVIGVGFLLTARNWWRVERMRGLGLSLGADYVQFRPVAGLDSYEWVPMALAELKRIGAMYTESRFRDLYDYWRGMYHRGYTVCRASELVPTIGADGTVWVCPNTRGMEGRALGNVTSESFAEIWSRREPQMVREDCEPTCRNHALNKTLEMVCAQQEHEAFV